MAGEKLYDPILVNSSLGGGHLETTEQGKRSLVSVVSGDRISYNVEGAVPGSASAAGVLKFKLGVRSVFLRSTVDAYVAPYTGKVATAADGKAADGRFFLAAGERVQLPWGTDTIEVVAVGATAGTLYAEGRV